MPSVATYFHVYIYSKFLPSKPGDTAGHVAAVACQTTRADELEEGRAASTVAAWSTNTEPALSKTHTGSAGEIREWPPLFSLHPYDLIFA